ncbi:hypothetical protein BU17DRAFT_51568 [Hysterangium stoloniferum]|nr:hypothetical protein BU17DRAFT_51568 [Hysterangium stoloniferum]
MEIQEAWTEQKAWLKYMANEWIPHREHWCHAWCKHVHYGIDTNNYIESWHSNLKWNYLHKIHRQWVDFLICVLSQEVEPDYFCAYIWVGMGLNNHTLCKAERQGKKSADELDPVEAKEKVRVVPETTVSYYFG